MSWSSTLEQSDDGPCAARFVIQLFRTVAEDISRSTAL